MIFSVFVHAKSGKKRTRISPAKASTHVQASVSSNGNSSATYHITVANTLYVHAAIGFRRFTWVSCYLGAGKFLGFQISFVRRIDGRWRLIIHFTGSSGEQPSRACIELSERPSVLREKLEYTVLYRDRQNTDRLYLE